VLEADDSSAGRPSWIQRAAAQQQPPQDLDAGPHPAQRFAPEPSDRQAPAFAPEQQAPAFAPEQQAPPFAPQQQAPPFAPQQQAPPFAPQQQAPSFAPQQAPSFAPQQQAPSFAPQQQAPSFAAAPDRRAADPERYDEALYGQLPGAPRDLLQEGEFDDPYAYQDDYGDGMADQEQSPRRSGMFTVAVVLALAVVGTGAAFAYRAYVGTERNGEPPIIRADTGPNKMIPPTQSGDASGKLIQDRMTGGATERLVSREEQPIDLRDGKSGPRVIFPPLNQNPNPPPAASAAPLNRPMSNSGNSMSANSANSMPLGASTSNAGNGTSANTSNGTVGGDEPRKIRTVSVRGDQTDAAANPAAKPTPAARNAAPSPAAPLRTPQPVTANANASTNAPMSIAPQAGAAPADAHTRMASTNSAPQPIAPVAVTSAGGYLVQISSQRNEADAQASFKSLQGKFPAMLGSREPLIKRADLGEKGVYYRAMVGPFGTPDEANQFCGSLKTAGGQCVVQRN
jgi:hypothetical protein